jgi:hypothetical protein
MAFLFDAFSFYFGVRRFYDARQRIFDTCQPCSVWGGIQICAGLLIDNKIGVLVNNG